MGNAASTMAWNRAFVACGITVHSVGMPVSLKTHWNCKQVRILSASMVTGAHVTGEWDGWREIVGDFVADTWSGVGSRMARRQPLRRAGGAMSSTGPRLTEAQVREIRKSTETLSELARRYGVSRMTIRDIRRRTRYGKVKD